MTDSVWSLKKKIRAITRIEGAFRLIIVGSEDHVEDDRKIQDYAKIVDGRAKLQIVPVHVPALDPAAEPSPHELGEPMTDVTVRDAVTMWFKDCETATELYGHISGWDTSGLPPQTFSFPFVKLAFR